MNCSNEGIRKDRALFEWLIFLQRWLNQPASAYNLKQIQRWKKNKTKKKPSNYIQKVLTRTSRKTSKNLTTHHWFNWKSTYYSIERNSWSLKGKFHIKKGAGRHNFNFLADLGSLAIPQRYLFKDNTPTLTSDLLCNQVMQSNYGIKQDNKQDMF